jgi:hypothetical protein
MPVVLYIRLLMWTDVRTVEILIIGMAHTPPHFPCGAIDSADSDIVWCLTFCPLVPNDGHTVETLTFSGD